MIFIQEHNSALLHITELKTRSEASDGVASLASQRLKELSEQLDDKENRQVGSHIFSIQSPLHSGST